MDSSEASWFAVWTKPRQEVLAKEHLERQAFEVFLPMAINPYQRRSRKDLRIEPLFPRYLFLHAIPETQNLATVRSTRGVVSMVRMGFELVRVPKGIIRGLKARQDPETELISLDPVPVNEGDAVRVFDGPFAGAEGILKQRCGEQRSLLMLSMLGRETTVEVDSLLLQKVS